MEDNGKPKQAILEVGLTVFAVVLIMIVGLITVQHIADTWMPDPTYRTTAGAPVTTDDIQELSLMGY